MMSAARRLAAFTVFTALVVPSVRAEPIARTTRPARPTSAGQAPAKPARCLRGEPLWGEAAVASKAIDELSGLTASRAQPGVFWVHNDSGDKARVFAIDLHGKLLLELALTNVKARDIEDIAIGPSRGGQGDFLYLADTGDNRHERSTGSIYRLEEPNVVRARTAGKKPRRRVKAIVVRYEDGPHDVETLLVDPRDGDLYLVAKGALLSSRQLVGVYRVPSEELERDEVLARKVASIPMGPATAGDILPDGSGIAIRNYTNLMFWPRDKGQTIADALKQAGCALPLADLGQQGEAFGFLPDGSGYVTIAEGPHARIYRYVLKRPE